MTIVKIDKDTRTIIMTTERELAECFDSHSGKEGGPMEPLRTHAKMVLAHSVAHLCEVPPRVADLLSEFWGARSLHGAVFREPQGIVFWHCNGCRVPTNPTGTRTWNGALTMAKQVARYCSDLQYLRAVNAPPRQGRALPEHSLWPPNDVARGSTVEHMNA